MRLVFLLLLLTNLAVFAVPQWDDGIRTKHDAPAPLHPERIQLMKEPRVQQDAEPPASREFAQRTNTAADGTLCMRWGPIPAARLDDAVAALDPLQLGDRLTQVAQGVPRGPYWVYFPPLASRAEADRKAAELASLGVRDLAVIRPPGQWQHAISLGLYARRAVAEARLAELSRKGVQDARIEARGKTASVFIFRDLNAAEQTTMAQLQRTFDGTRLDPVECTQTSN